MRVMTPSAQGSAATAAPPAARPPSQAAVEVRVAAPTSTLLDVLTSPERFPGFLGDVLDARLAAPQAPDTPDAPDAPRDGARPPQTVQVKLRLLHEPIEARWVLQQGAIERPPRGGEGSADTDVFGQQVVWRRASGEPLVGYEARFVIEALGTRGSKLKASLSLTLSSEYADTLQHHVTLQHLERAAVQISAEAERRARRARADRAARTTGRGAERQRPRRGRTRA